MIIKISFKDVWSLACFVSAYFDFSSDRFLKRIKLEFDFKNCPINALHSISCCKFVA